MERTSRDVDGYLASLPDEVRNDMLELDREISDVMQGHEREIYEGIFWGGSEQTIIGYGRWSYQRSDKQPVEWFMIGLALQKRYISIYVNAVKDGKYLSEVDGASIGKVKVGKSNVSLASVDDVDLEALRVFLADARDLMTADAG